MPFATPVTGRYLRYVVNTVATSGDGHGWWSACLYEMAISAGTPPIAGALDHLVLTPGTRTIAPDAHVTYAVRTSTRRRSSLGAITDAVLTIIPDGSCSAYDCTRPRRVTPTVARHQERKTGTATLTVDPQLHAISASASSAAPGARQQPSNAFDGELRDVLARRPMGAGATDP